MVRPKRKKSLRATNSVLSGIHIAPPAARPLGCVCYKQIRPGRESWPRGGANPRFCLWGQVSTQLYLIVSRLVGLTRDRLPGQPVRGCCRFFLAGQDISIDHEQSGRGPSSSAGCCRLLKEKKLWLLQFCLSEGGLKLVGRSAQAKVVVLWVQGAKSPVTRSRKRLFVELRSPSSRRLVQGDLPSSASPKGSRNRFSLAATNWLKKNDAGAGSRLTLSGRRGGLIRRRKTGGRRCV